LTEDVIMGGIGFVLALLAFSYLLGDNALYRIAVSIFVGATAAFLLITVITEVLVPWLQPIIEGNTNPGDFAFRMFPFLVGFLLLLKSSKRLAPWGNAALGFVLGVGSAVAMLGAVGGTLIPQASAAGRVSLIPGANMLDWFNGLLMTVGTICTLLYFQYLARRKPDGTIERPLPLKIAAGIGRGFVVVTLATIYATAIVGSLSVFVAQIDTWRVLAAGLGGG
jgi:hypothetical protein